MAMGDGLVLRGWPRGALMVVFMVASMLLAATGCRRTPRRPGGPDGGAAPRASDAGAPRLDAQVHSPGLVDAGADLDSDAEVDDPPGVLRGEPTLGPFAAPEQLCASLLAKLTTDERDRARCARETDPGPAVGPYQEPQEWQFEDADENFDRYLMFRLDGRWFATLAGGWTTMNTSNGDLTVGRLSARDVIPGGAPELLFDVVELSSDMDDFDATRFDEVTRRTVCSTGASGHPSCVGFTIAGRGEDHSDFADRKRYRFQLDCRFQPDGRVNCRARGKPAADLIEDLEGTFTLLFP